MLKKTERGDPLVSPGMVCYAGKQEKPFWFSSLGQMVQFGAIIFCRTLKNYFGQFVWIEKKRKKVPMIVAFHFMKRRLKKFNSSQNLTEIEKYLTAFATKGCLKKPTRVFPESSPC